MDFIDTFQAQKINNLLSEGRSRISQANNFYNKKQYTNALKFYKDAKMNFENANEFASYFIGTDAYTEEAQRNISDCIAKISKIRNNQLEK